jgi:predicted metal-dependent RNase
MRITLLGASGGEVTGSAYLVQTDQASILVDCGMFQGSRKAIHARFGLKSESPRYLETLIC